MVATNPVSHEWIEAPRSGMFMESSLAGQILSGIGLPW
jgi:hypothetical protein